MEKGIRLDDHLTAVKDGKLVFENVFQSVSRMILTGKNMIKKVNLNGRTTYDFQLFRQGPRHIIGM